MPRQQISLTAALRSNLLNLQSTQRQMDITQLRLATGRKVNTALDNANSFFASQSLLNRSTDLGRLLDGIGQSIQVIKSADDGITLLTDYLEQMQAIAQEAVDQSNAAGGGANPPADRVQLNADFLTTQQQLDNSINDAGYRGNNLIDGGVLTITFNEDASDTLTVTGVTFDAATLGIGPLPVDFADVATAQAVTTQIQNALNTVRAQARTFGTNLNIIQAREDFTKNLINTLKEGSDKLILADQNEEGAKLLSLQTAQQLGVQSLSLASQAQQSILRLFG